MRFMRIYNDADGASHFEDVDVEMARIAYAPPTPPLDLSAPYPVERALLFEFPAGWSGDWHPSPRRQFYVNLGGRLEVEVSDGETRKLDPGDIVLLEDLTGLGHVTRPISDETSRGLFIHLLEQGSA